MATIEDNDPHYDSEFMQEATSAAWLIHNEFVGRTSAAQIIIRELDVNIPPGTPNEFDAYLIGSSPQVGSAWEGLPGRIAFWLGGWKFIVVKNGMRVMVNSGLPGQHGYWMDFWVSGWSAHGGSQLLTVFDSGGGQFEADWNLKYGQTARVVLNQSTVTINRAFGVRYGRIHTLIVQQDGVGGRALSMKAAEWLLPGGSPITQPAQAPNAVSVYTFIQPGENFNGSMLTSVSLDLQDA